MLTVVKVGGGLASEAGDEALRALCTALGELGSRHPLLVVPGGGEFADAVREQDRRLGLRSPTAHRMALLAMDQFGWALADLIPGAARCVDLAPRRDGAVSSCCRPRCSRSATPSRRRGPSPRTRSPHGWPAPPAPIASCC